MKNIFLSVMILISCIANSQTAANWTVNDCSGTSRELFKDLDAGKVAVIVWVMPCASCINEALMAQAEVQNALAANPGKIIFYVADDYANTTCATLSGWCQQNGITDAILLSSKSVSMNPYGADGMPKVVVAAGTDHKVYYNENAPDITQNGIKDAIAAAMAAPTGIYEGYFDNLSVNVFPNPAVNITKVSVKTPGRGDKLELTLNNQLGQVIALESPCQFINGEYIFEIDTFQLPAGLYFIKIGNGTKSVQQRLYISH
jgi:hypothetical protein